MNSWIPLIENGYMMLSEYQNASTQLKDRWAETGRREIHGYPVDSRGR